MKKEFKFLGETLELEVINKKHYKVSTISQTMNFRAGAGEQLPNPETFIKWFKNHFKK